MCVWHCLGMRSVRKANVMRLVSIMSAKRCKLKLQDDIRGVRGGGYSGVCCFDRMGVGGGHQKADFSVNTTVRRRNGSFVTHTKYKRNKKKSTCENFKIRFKLWNNGGL